MADPSSPRLWSPRRARWLLTLFPPLFFQRVRVVEIAEDFRFARVQVRRSLLTRNLNGTTFGGALFAAADPIHAILYWQILARRGYVVQTWLKAARIEYSKPAGSDVEYEARIGDDDVAAAVEGLENGGRFVRTHVLEARDRAGEACARVEVDVYVRLLRRGHRTLSGF